MNLWHQLLRVLSGWPYEPSDPPRRRRKPVGYGQRGAIISEWIATGGLTPVEQDTLVRLQREQSGLDEQQQRDGRGR